MGRARTALLAVALGLASVSGDAAPLAISASPVDLDPERPAVERVGALRYRGGLELRADDPRFGGLSALDVSDDGSRLLALSDHGDWVTARVRYDTRGRLAGLDGAAMGVLPPPPKKGSRRRNDSESLARFGRGVAVGFERIHAVVAYALDAAGAPVAPRPLAPLPGAAALASNASLEALARLADGRLLAIAEGAAAAEGTTPVWIGDGRSWRRTALAVDANFRPTGAARASDGRILVLERRFTWIGGAAVRIRALDPTAVDGDPPMRAATLATLAPPFAVDNFEGIAVRTGQEGEMLVYLVSDDNFSALQRTLLLMFALDPAGPN